MSRSAIVSRIAHVGPTEPSGLRGDAPWWDELDADFSRKEERFE